MNGPEKTGQHHRLGVVSYLNSRPLVYGLEADSRLAVRFEVPSRLSRLMEQGDIDVALLPVIDLVASPQERRIIGDGCIGCNGETLTVRIFSDLKAENIRRLHVDGDSHTSIALARVLWGRRFDVDLDMVPWAGEGPELGCEAVLLIGDKVVTRRPAFFDREIDLGLEWKRWTGLPFVFAVWAAAVDMSLGDLPERLNRARDAGTAHCDAIAEACAPVMHWPVETARRYLKHRLNFTLTPRHREGLNRFLQEVQDLGLAKGEARAVLSGGSSVERVVA